MENIFQNEMSKKDKELDELRRNLDIKKDDDQVKLLQETLQKLRKEISEKNKKIEELEKINKEPNNNAMNAFFMKGSNLKDIL
jgi:prefoldin subunit 5